MALKQEIEDWVKALDCYKAGNHTEALHRFLNFDSPDGKNGKTSKICFNIGMIYAANGEHEAAIAAFMESLKLDPYLAVAYFQMGVSKFLLEEFEQALLDFREALRLLRSNDRIDYSQIGLEFQLFRCEVMFNIGLCYIRLNYHERGLKFLEDALEFKREKDHNVIDEALEEQGVNYTIFSMSEGILYEPGDDKVRNVTTRDYLGSSRLVAASLDQDESTGFAGSQSKAKQAAAKPVKPVEQNPQARGRDYPPPDQFSPRQPVRANTVASPASMASRQSVTGREYEDYGAVRRSRTVVGVAHSEDLILTCHYPGKGTRLVKLPLFCTYEEFAQHLKEKFNLLRCTSLRVRDTDGGAMIDIENDEELNLARDIALFTAKANARNKGTPQLVKMEVWVLGDEDPQA